MEGNRTYRFERWSSLDKLGDREPMCWLDRQTGKLVYRGKDVDPNDNPLNRETATILEWRNTRQR